MSDEYENDLAWHALNYRTAATQHAEQMWQELEACVKRLNTRTSGWQPIETAPKDGSFILLLTPYGIIQGHWNDDCWNQNVCDSTYEMACAVISADPTHWMPLPEPPNEQS